VNERKMGDEEMKKFLAAQNALALVAYVHTHDFAINPISFLKRDDDVAHKIRHDAGLEWVAVHAARFRDYWESHREEMLAFDAGDEAACKSLLKELR
jgi:hypothetical protein